jgi:DNA transformation protein and related proteins
MTKQNSFLSYVLEQLSPHGPITARAMFGGYGVYWDNVMFALIADNQLYFRVDEITSKDYEPYNSEPFVYEGMKKPVTLPYLTLPIDILENSQELPEWIKRAYQTSLRHKKSPSKKKKA